MKTPEKEYTDREKVMIYENVFHRIQMYREVAMNQKKLTALLDIIGDWSYAHRMGNGMMDNAELVRKQLERMK